MAALTPTTTAAQQFAPRLSVGDDSILTSVGKPESWLGDGDHLQDESHKTPEKGKQGGLVVPIHLPTKHLPRRKTGFFLWTPRLVFLAFKYQSAMIDATKGIE